jgi:hypothetical protein
VQARGNRGRLFFLGVGGSTGNCSHAVNDFRKIVGIEAMRQLTTSRSLPREQMTKTVGQHGKANTSAAI